MSEPFPGNQDPQEPLDDPSTLGGNAALQPSDDEQYGDKLHILEGILEEQTQANLTAQRETFIKAVGGFREAQRVDLWEAIKKRGASSAFGQVSHLLGEVAADAAKPAEERDAFDDVATSVTMDIRGTTDSNRVQAGPNVTDFNVGSNLDRYIGTGELQDPALLAKATKTIHLLVADGLYKLNAWGNASQLQTALDLVEKYTAGVPDFNPAEAGFHDARDSLTMARAALDVDQTTKPNYQYAKPERSYLFAQTTAGLRILDRTEAHMFLRYNDFELPDQTDAPQEEPPQA